MEYRNFIIIIMDYIIFIIIKTNTLLFDGKLLTYKGMSQEWSPMMWIT